MTDQLLTDELVVDELVVDELVVDELVVDEINEQPVDSVVNNQSEPEISSKREMTELEKLISRRTGFFPVNLQMDDIKWLKNACNSEKFKFEGPNEAFMIMNCYMGFAAALARMEQDPSLKSVEVQASAVEAAAIMIARYEGSGLELAKRVFRIAIALNGPAMEMKKLDNEIEILKNQNK